MWTIACSRCGAASAPIAVAAAAPAAAVEAEALIYGCLVY